MSVSRARIAGAAAGLFAFAALVLFALYNRGNPIVLDFGLLSWRGEAVTAIYAGVFAGLLAMFAAGLPADLAARRERARLERLLRASEGGADARREPPPGA